MRKIDLSQLEMIILQIQRDFASTVECVAQYGGEDAGDIERIVRSCMKDAIVSIVFLIYAGNTSTSEIFDAYIAAISSLRNLVNEKYASPAAGMMLICDLVEAEDVEWREEWIRVLYITITSIDLHESVLSPNPFTVNNTVIVGRND